MKMTKDNNTPLNDPGLVFDEDMDMSPTIAAQPDFQKPSASPQKSKGEPDFEVKSSDTNEEIEFVLKPEEIVAPRIDGITGQAIAVVPSRELEPAKMLMGDKLVSMGLITPDQLNVALQEKKISGKMIGEILVDLGFIDADTLSDFLAQSSGVDIFDPQKTLIDGEALGLIEKDVALRHHVLPFSIFEGELSVAMADPYDVVALDILKKHIPKGLKIKPCVSTPHVIAEAIDASYGYASSVSAILKELEGQSLEELGEVAGLSEEEAYSHPLVRLVNALIYEAVKIGASDLHFEPEENFSRLRYRIDGVLSTVQILHKQHWNGVSQRIKLMASLNIADKLAPQDGRIKMSVAGHDVDFRVSSLPTVHGENIVMRVLDKQSSIMPLSSLGFSDVNKERIEKAQKRPEGIIIVTGPTGSGKTTTLYSMLNEINSVDVNIQTLEDPVEYSLPMIRQTQVREGVLEFADGIRALLRQDPDIIFIGEIRDKTTAEMALQAAMTGHQVYTSLHTNDSFGALPRLFDLGMVPGMIAGNIVSIFAQRLARTLCPNCKQQYQATDEECKILGVTDTPQLFQAHQGGCDTCGGQGYKGRVAIAEVLLFDDEMDEIVARKGTKAELNEVALSKGFKNMRDDAMLKVLEGKTTFDAISKVVDITK
jgi:general secretion pathway protein E/type IV pilus assembly protein PilB